jgi:ParB family chromosome partitioning protein
MKKVTHKKTPEGPAETVHSTAKNDDQPIPLDTIETCMLNPRALSDSDITSLATDIEKHGLLQPVTLNTMEDGRFEVVLGTRRLRAITKIRGTDGVLEPGEYQVVTWSDEQCLTNALAENEEREGISAFEAGDLLNHAMKEIDGMTDAKLSKLTRFGDRGAINELRDLATHFGRLPQSWQADLKMPMVCGSDDKPAISRTHFKHVRALVKLDPIPPALIALMQQAATERMSTAAFKEALDNLNPTPKAKKAEGCSTEHAAGAGGSEGGGGGSSGSIARGFGSAGRGSWSADQGRR